MNAHGPASDGDLTWIPISRFAPIMHPQRVHFATQNDSAMRPSTIYEFIMTSEMADKQNPCLDSETGVSF